MQDRYTVWLTVFVGCQHWYTSPIRIEIVTANGLSSGENTSEWMGGNGSRSGSNNCIMCADAWMVEFGVITHAYAHVCVSAHFLSPIWISPSLCMYAHVYMSLAICPSLGPGLFTSRTKCNMATITGTLLSVPGWLSLSHTRTHARTHTHHWAVISSVLLLTPSIKSSLHRLRPNGAKSHM